MSRGLFCTSVSAKSVEEMSLKAKRAFGLGAEVAEFRLDHLERPDAGEILGRLSRYSKRCVLTVRSKDEGGGFDGGEEERVRLLAEVCEMRPAFVDLEFEAAREFGNLLRRMRLRAGKLILSWHDLHGTPDSLELVKRRDRMSRSGGIVKIVTLANLVEDNLRVLSLYERGRRNKLVAFCMGERGAFSRVLSFCAGSPLVYTALPGESVAPGQLSLADVRELVKIIG